MRDGVRMSHRGFALFMPAGGVHALRDAVTTERDLFVVTHMGLAEIDAASWWLEVGGLVETPLRLTLRDFVSMPHVEVHAVHECAGSPLTPREPKRRIGSVVWSGVPLAHVLDRAGLRCEATFVWSEGLEWGEFAGIRDEPYVKDLPLTKVSDAILATHMNGDPLTARRGGPVRLVVPGWYGTNSVKWLGRLTAADHRATGAFTTRFYNDPGPDGPVPVWGVAPECVLVRPAPSDVLRAGRAVLLRGWAWGEREVACAEIRVNGGAWAAAELGTRIGFSWQAFSRLWVPPAAGTWRLSCRCFDTSGTGQPVEGARNAVHTIEVMVAR